jgi:hypothetical protein
VRELASTTEKKEKKVDLSKEVRGQELWTHTMHLIVCHEFDGCVRKYTQERR